MPAYAKLYAKLGNNSGCSTNLSSRSWRDLECVPSSEHQDHLGLFLWLFLFVLSSFFPLSWNIAYLPQGAITRMATTETGFALFLNFYISFFFMPFRSPITPLLIQRVFLSLILQNMVSLLLL